jgi:hypothetical protein
MTAWIMGIYFVGFGLSFLALLFLASVGNLTSLGGSLSSEAIMTVLVGSFFWPILLVIIIVAYSVYRVKQLFRKEKNGLRNTA